jgi:hypothetical protein
MNCPEHINWIELDVIAECYDISNALYRKLWELTAEFDRAGTAAPMGGDGSNGTTEEPIIGGGYANELGLLGADFPRVSRPRS